MWLSIAQSSGTCNPMRPSRDCQLSRRTGGGFVVSVSPNTSAAFNGVGVATRGVMAVGAAHALNTHARHMNCLNCRHILYFTGILYGRSFVLTHALDYKTLQASGRHVSSKHSIGISRNCATIDTYFQFIMGPHSYAQPLARERNTTAHFTT